MVIPKHILGTFDEALTSLRNDLLMMAGLAGPLLGYGSSRSVGTTTSDLEWSS